MGVDISYNIMLMCGLLLSSLTHFDLIHSLFQICINSQGEEMTQFILFEVEYEQNTNIVR